MEKVIGLAAPAIPFPSSVASTPSRLWASPPSAPLSDRQPDLVLYCVPDPAGSWHVQRYAPLIDIHDHQRFMRVSYNGTWLRTALIRSFHETYELAFEYKFDLTGKLSARHGYLHKFSEWNADADLFPSADGKLAPPEVHYARGSANIIAEPDNGAQYTRNFDQVESIPTINELPCAASLKAMEKN